MPGDIYIYDATLVITLPLDAVKSISHAGLAIAPGTLAKVSGTSTIYLIDDLTRKIKLASAEEISQLPGFGPKIAEIVLKALSES